MKLLQVTLFFLTFLSSVEHTAATRRIKADPIVKEGSDDVAPIYDAEEISRLFSEAGKTRLTFEEISNALKNRHQWILLQKIVGDYKYGDQSAIGITSFAGIPFTSSSLPMPRLAQLEAVAQLAEIVCLHLVDVGDYEVSFDGVDGVEWMKDVFPGDTLVMEVEVITWSSNDRTAKVTGKAYLNGEVALAVEVMQFSAVDEE